MMSFGMNMGGQPMSSGAPVMQRNMPGVGASPPAPLQRPYNLGAPRLSNGAPPMENGLPQMTGGIPAISAPNPQRPFSAIGNPGQRFSIQSPTY